MRFHIQSKLFLASVGSIAILLALGRCSPLAPSVSKFGKSTGSSSIANNNSLTANMVKIVRYKTTVLESGTLDETLSKLPGDVKLVSLTPIQLADFQQRGEVEVRLAHDQTTDLVQVFCELGEELHTGRLEVARILGFDTQLTQKNHSTDPDAWILSYSSTADPHSCQEMAQRFNSIVIAISGKSHEETIVSPEPSPEPSPSPSAEPSPSASPNIIVLPSPVPSDLIRLLSVNL